MYKEPGLPVFGSRIQQVEHIGYTMFIADRAGVHAPKVVKTGVGGPDAAVLVTTPQPGTPLGELATEQITDDVLASLWNQVDQLHSAGISHNELDPLRILVADGAGRVRRLHRGRRDRSEVLAGLRRRGRARRHRATRRQRPGDRRRGHRARQGPARRGAAGRATRVASRPRPRRARSSSRKTLKELRDQAATATGADEVKPLEIQRLTWANIGILAGVIVALAIAIPGLAGVDWDSVKGEFEHAIWGWALLAAVLYPLVPMAWASALMGCVNKDLPSVPTGLTQLACTFLNLVTPNGIGGTALQLDYLHKQGVPPVSGASAMGLSTGVGGAIQMGALPDRGVDHRDRGRHQRQRRRTTRASG